MPSTYEPIASSVVSGSSTNSISFSSIPATYTDLRLIIECSTSGASSIFLNCNNNTSAVYSNTYMDSDGTNYSSFRRSSQTKLILSGSTAPILQQIDFFSYTGSTLKSVLYNTSTVAPGSYGTVLAGVGLIQTSSAISSIQITLGNPVFFTAGSTATIYGIKEA